MSEARRASPPTHTVTCPALPTTGLLPLRPPPEGASGCHWTRCEQVGLRPGVGWGDRGGCHQTFCFSGGTPESPREAGAGAQGPLYLRGKEEPGKAPPQTFAPKLGGAEAWRPCSGSQQAAEAWYWGQGPSGQVTRCAGLAWGTSGLLSLSSARGLEIWC